MSKDRGSISHSSHESDSDVNHEHKKQKKHKEKKIHTESHHKNKRDSHHSHHSNHSNQESEPPTPEPVKKQPITKQVSVLYADPPNEIESHQHDVIQAHPVHQYQTAGATKDPDEPLNVAYTPVPPNTQHHQQTAIHHQQAIIQSHHGTTHPSHHTQHTHHTQHIHQVAGSHAAPVIMRTQASRARVWWHVEVSKAAHIFAATLLFISIFSTAPWLSYFSWYSDYCRLEENKTASGGCRVDARYRCSVCIIIGYVWILLAFFILLARIVAWISSFEFPQKTTKNALILDLIVVALIFITVILMTVGATEPHPDGKSKIDRDYPLMSDLLFGTEMAIWFALVGMIVAVIIDVIGMRSEQ